MHLQTAELERFFLLMQRRLAQSTIGAEALRNQGSPGLVDRCRNYFEHDLDLESFVHSLDDLGTLQDFLDYHTMRMQKRFPPGCRNNFGAARKTLNLFLRGVVYNKYFADYYGFSRSFKANTLEIQWMEIPLDSYVAKGIKHALPDLPLKWKSIKSLTPDDNAIYQDYAYKIAQRMGTARIHLDMIYWRPSL